MGMLVAEGLNPFAGLREERVACGKLVGEGRSYSGTQAKPFRASL